MKAEYKEGPEARENFERTLTKIFQAPKIFAPCCPYRGQELPQEGQ
jgi:hypothetical protein